MKILYITTIGATMGFFKSFIQELVNDGHTVDIACNEQLAPVEQFYTDLECKQYHLDCTRSPFAKGNITCVKQIKKLVEENQYDIVHCHTPIAAACTRLACKGLRKKRKNTEHPLRVFYTAHGFHFYNGAPLKNWLIYYPVEWICAHWTDVLITMNKEDYALAQRKLYCGGKCRAEYVPGVGINLDKFKQGTIDSQEKRNALGIKHEEKMLLSVGELSARKNHEIVIKALAKLNNPKIKYFVVGEGPLELYLNDLVRKLNLTENVFFLGYRSDIAELCQAADLFVFPSHQEGLPVALMEAIACKTPVLCSRIRGNVDLVSEERELFNQKDINDFLLKYELFNSIKQDVNKKYLALQAFSSDNVIAAMKRLYY